MNHYTKSIVPDILDKHRIFSWKITNLNSDPHYIYSLYCDPKPSNECLDEILNNTPAIFDIKYCGTIEDAEKLINKCCEVANAKNIQE